MTTQPCQYHTRTTIIMAMYNSGSYKHSTGREDDLDGEPSYGFWPKWFAGIALPLATLVYGIKCIVTQRGNLPGDNQAASSGLDLTGDNAIALGISLLAVAAFLHLHYFWGNIYCGTAPILLGKITAAITFILAVAYLVIQVGVLG